MKKNLKKVISAVIAMALAASMIPATLAANVALSDVADTASYATAVNTLVALGVINGYEDGTFLPDNNITRAEVSKVMVAALNKLDDATKRAGATQFTDVAADHWASGFINVGVSNKIVNGMGDGTFAPQANVTIAQVVKMLAAAMGYEQYAAFLGEGQPNWYDGWMDAAEAAGFTDNINAGAEDAATRAEVAQLVYDALLTPIVEENGYEFSDGKYVPKIAVQDGVDSKYYKTLLTEKFDAYYVEGYVVGKSKVEGEAVVSIAVADSEAYANADFAANDDMPVNTKAAAVSNGVALTDIALGNTDADQYIGVYASAIVLDDDGEYSLISFVPSGKNKSIVFDVEDIDKNSDAEYIDDEQKLEVNGTEYKLADSIDLYVNGQLKTIDITATTDADTSGVADNCELLYNYIHNYNVGTVEMVDTYKTDGKYDAFYVNLFATAEVVSVSASSGVISYKNGTIDGTQTAFSGKIILDEEDNEDLEYSITKNGEAITIGEIKKGDIISFAYDISFTSTAYATTILNSDWFDIYVSSDEISGKLTNRDKKLNTLTIGGEVYGFVDSTVDVDYDDTYTIGNEYTLSLDAFGRIFSHKIDSTNDLWGVITKLTWSTADDKYKVNIYTPEGSVKTYLLDATKADVNGIKAGVFTAATDDGDAKYTKSDVNAELINVVYTGTAVDADALENVQNRVVTYKVSTVTGGITKITSQSSSANSGVYKPKTNSLAGAKVNDNTVLLDVVEYKDSDEVSDILVSAMDKLTENVTYQVYPFGNRDNNNGAYPFVLITSGVGAYSETSRFAYVIDAGSVAEDETGKYDQLQVIEALYDGELVDLFATEEVDVSTLAAGDVIFFQTESNGYITDIDEVFALSLSAEIDDIYDIINTVDSAALITAPGASFTKAWDNDDLVQLVFGPVVEVSSTGSMIDVAQVASDKTYLGDDATDTDETDGVYRIAMSDETTKVYKIDYSEEDEEDRYSVAYASEILPTNISIAHDTATDIIDWTDFDADTYGDITYVFAMVVDGDAVCVVYYTAQ